jgi:hypothetical protein
MDNPGARGRYQFGEQIKSMNPQKLQQLRVLLGDMPDFDAPESGAEYKKMLFHEEYYAAQQAWRAASTPEAQRIEAAKMKAATVTVYDLEEELEYTADGWRASPADFAGQIEAMKVDPRIPVGREARLAAKEKRESVADELARIRRRLAELTGQVEDVPALPTVAASGVIRRKVVPTKRKHDDATV